MDMCNIYLRHVNKKADICVSLLVQVHTNSPACLMEPYFLELVYSIKRSQVDLLSLLIFPTGIEF